MFGRAAQAFARWARRNAVLAPSIALVCVVSVAIHQHFGLVFPEAVYQTIQLFVLQSDVHVGALPRDASPTWQHHVLWILRFSAPLLTAGAFVDLVRQVGLLRRRPVRWRDHVVIAGAGRLGVALAGLCRKSGLRVVAIERDADNANLEGLRHLGARVVIGDAMNASTLTQAGIERAAALVAVTRDDVVNVSAGSLASQAQGEGSRFRAFVHVADLGLKEGLERAMSASHRAHLRFINTYEMAADELVARHGAEEAGARPRLHLVAGFVRFGRCVLRKLMDVDPRGDSSYWVVDPAYDTATVVATVESWPRGRAGQVQHFATDMLAGRLWDELERVVGEGMPARFLICTDDDLRNLSFALSVLRRRTELDLDLQLVTRVFQWPLPIVGDGEDLIRDIGGVSLMELVCARFPRELAELVHRDGSGAASG